MDIRVSCPNGHALKVGEKFAGKKVACPKCKAPFTIPAPQAAPEPEIPPSDPLMGGQSTDDPLFGNPAGGNADLSSDWLSGSLANLELADMAPVAAPTPTLNPPVSRSPAPPAPASRGTPPKVSRKLVLVGLAAGSGFFVGMLLFSLMLWLVFGGRRQTTVAAAPSSGSAAAAPTTPAAPAAPAISTNTVPASGNSTSAAGSPGPGGEGTAAESLASVPGASAEPAAAAPAASSSPAAVARQAVAGWQLAEPACSFEMNPETGDMVAVCAQSAHLYLYPAAEIGQPGAKVVGPVKCGRTPVHVTFKKFGAKSFFVVADMNDPVIRLFEAESLQPAGEINIAKPNVAVVAAAASSEDPYVYYSAIRERLDFDIYRINLKTMSDEGLWYRDIMTPVLSARGTYLYTRGGHSGSSGFGAALNVPNAVNLGGVSNTSSLVQDDREQYVLTAKGLHTADMKTMVGEFGFHSLCFLPGRPFVAGVSDTELLVASMNSFETLGKVTLPAGLLPDPPDRNASSRRRGEVEKTTDREAAQMKRWSQFAEQIGQSVHPQAVCDQLRVMADPRKNRLVVARRGLAAVVSLDQFQLPTEPLLAVRYQGPSSLALGETLSAKLSFDPNVTVRLSDPPAGMRLDGDTLTWTPTYEQAGEFRVLLDLISVKRTIKQLIPIVVRRPSLAGSFPVRDVVMSTTETMALALGWDPQADDPRQSRTAAMHLALLDITQQAVVAETKFTGPVTVAALDSHYAYLLRENTRERTSQLVVLSVKDLSLVKEFPVIPPSGSGPGSNGQMVLVPVAEKYLVADKIYALPDLTVLPNCSVNQAAMTISSANVAQIAGRHRNYWLFDGVVYDSPDLKSVSLIWGFTPFSEFLAGKREARWGPFPWASWREPNGDRFQLAHVPVAVELEPIRDGMLLGQAIVASNLVNRSAVEKRWPIAAGFMKAGNGNKSPISIAGSSVAAVLDDRVHFLTLEGLADLPEPPHFEPRQSRFAFSSKGPTKLQYQIRGGTPPYRQVETNRDYPTKGGFESNDGRVEIEVDPNTEHPAFSKLAAQAKYRIVTGLTTEMQIELKRAAAAATGKSKKQVQPKGIQLDLLDKYKARVATFLRQKLGANAPRGVPAPVLIQISAMDADNRRFSIEHWMFVEIPEKEIREALETKE